MNDELLAQQLNNSECDNYTLREELQDAKIKIEGLEKTVLHYRQEIENTQEKIKLIKQEFEKFINDIKSANGIKIDTPFPTGMKR